MSKRMRQVKSLRQWHYVVYRGARSGKRRSFTSRAKLLAEVYSKKSGKRIGYINKMHGIQPIPRKFSNKARLIYHEGRKISKKREEITHADTFSINYNNWVPDQIPNWFTTLLNNHIDQKSYIQFKLGIKGMDNKKLLQDLKSESYNAIKEKTHREWLDILTTLIIQTLRGNKIRTSPKKYSKSRYWYSGKNIAQWHYVKKYRVRLIITA